MNKMSRQLVLVLLAVCFAVVLGCKTDHPGVKNSMGTIKTTLAADPPTVTAAAKSVLEDMDLKVVNESSTKIDGVVIGRTAQDTKISINVKKAGPDVSDISIRVGTMGDSELGLTIYEEIKKKLNVE